MEGPGDALEDVRTFLDPDGYAASIRQGRAKNRRIEIVMEGPRRLGA
jgi:hypothetical protein